VGEEVLGTKIILLLEALGLSSSVSSAVLQASTHSLLEFAICVQQARTAQWGQAPALPAQLARTGLLWGLRVLLHVLPAP